MKYIICKECGKKKMKYPGAGLICAECYNKKRRDYSRENIIIINGIRYNKKTAPKKIQGLIETMIVIRKKRNLYNDLRSSNK